MSEKLYTTIVKDTVKYHILKPNTMMGSVAVIIEKNGKALLIDAQFFNTDARNILSVLKEKKLELTALYYSHSDPDYYFGADLLKKAYPDLKIFSTRYTLARIKKSFQQKLDIWMPVIGEEAPKEIYLPEIIFGKLSFEGSEFKIIGDDPYRTCLYNAEDGLVLGGISICVGDHLFLADTPTISDQESWIDTIKQIEKLQPNCVIPGHLEGKQFLDLGVLQETKHYLETFIQSTKKAKNSESLIADMQSAYPEWPIGNLELSAKVVMGEKEWDPVPVSAEEVLTLATETYPFSGKQAIVHFETGYHFQLSYSEDNHMTWTSLSGTNEGQSETERIYVHQISDCIYTVNWIESTGLSVSHTINLEQGIVWAYMTWNNSDKYGGREVLVHGGLFKLLS